MEPVVKPVFAYALFIRGTWGRLRKSTFKGFNLIQDSAATVDEAEVRRLAEEQLAVLKVKPGSTWRVVEQPMELKTYSDGVTMRSFVLYSDRTLFTGAV